MIEPADAQYYNLNDLIPWAPENPTEMLNELFERVNEFKDQDLKKVALHVLNEKGRELLICPAAKSIHHAARGGLLYHKVRMFRHGLGVARDYDGEFKRDLLLTGIIIHDIGKLDEFVLEPLTGLVSDYSIQGKLIGHIGIGLQYIAEVCKECQVRPEVKEELSQMILSHHGKPEFGSPVASMFLEAYLLHSIDERDAKIWIFNEEIKKIKPGALEPKCYALDDRPVDRPSAYDPQSDDERVAQFAEVNDGYENQDAYGDKDYGEPDDWPDEDYGSPNFGGNPFRNR